MVSEKDVSSHHPLAVPRMKQVCCGIKSVIARKGGWYGCYSVRAVAPRFRRCDIRPAFTGARGEGRVRSGGGRAEGGCGGMGVVWGLSEEEEGSLRSVLEEELGVGVGCLRRCTGQEGFGFAQFVCGGGKDVCVCIANGKEVNPVDPVEAFGKNLELHMPKVLMGSGGKIWIPWVNGKGCQQYVLAMECKPGKPWFEARPQSRELLRSLGNAAGRLCSARREVWNSCGKGPQNAGGKECQLQAMSRSGAREQYSADAALTHIGEISDSSVKDAQIELESCSTTLKAKFESVETGSLKNLRMCPSFDSTDLFCVGANGANRVEIVRHLFGVQSVSVVHAVAGLVAESLSGRIDLMDASFWILRGFNESLPLKEEEIKGLYSAVEDKLVTGTKSFSKNVSSSDASTDQTLSAWRKISPSLAMFAFRHACGMEPCPTAPRFQSWVDENHATFSSIFEFDLNAESCLVFDFSVWGMSSKYLHSMDDSPTSIKHVRNDLATCQAKYGIGRYLEPRLVYTTDAYKIPGNERLLSRTIHLGIDLFSPANTPIRNPVAGVVHSFRNNSAPRDYGPTVIVEHRVAEDCTFYTLFGHLSAESLEGKYVGCYIDKGEILGWIGAPDVNGGWAPHLHYQIMLDVCDCTGDFVGAAYPHMKDIYSSLCPNPNSLLRIVPGKLESGRLPSPKAPDQVLEVNAMKTLQENSVTFVRGFSQFYYDQFGNDFLNMCARMHPFGHNHPRLHCATMDFSSQMKNDSWEEVTFIDKCSKAVSSKFPRSLQVCLFLKTEKDALDMAAYLAQCGGEKRHSPVSGHHDMLHPTPNIRDSLAFDGSNMERRSHPSECCQEEHNVVSWITETCSSLLQVTENLCVVHEVQTGFGRLGSHFWGFEKCGYAPDIVVLGVAPDSDHPVGAVITSHEIATAANVFNDFPAVGQDCRSACLLAECMKIMDDDRLQESAQQKGALFLSGIHKLQETHIVINNAKGCGLLLTFDMVEAENCSPSKRNASYVVNRLMDAGVFTEQGGKHENTIIFTPPLTISEQNIRLVLANLEMILKEDALG